MADLHRILADHRSKRVRETPDYPKSSGSSPIAGLSEIPDLFFDQILVEFKLSRIEIMVYMILYRKVWCHPNLYKEYGISPLLSHAGMAEAMSITLTDLYMALKKFEDQGLISTIRSGQYFVRKYITQENDEFFHQNYHDFEM